MFWTSIAGISAIGGIAYLIGIVQAYRAHPEASLPFLMMTAASMLVSFILMACKFVVVIAVATWHFLKSDDNKDD